MNRENAFQNLCASLDTDEEFLETLLPYLENLLTIGVNLNDLALQQAIEAHMQQLETACMAVIGYAGSLVHRGRCFESEIHATRCFMKALVERWEPHANWKEQIELLPQSRYVSPYEKARRLIYELQSKDTAETWSPNILDPLSDREIEDLILQLETTLAALQH